MHIHARSEVAQSKVIQRTAEQRQHLQVEVPSAIFERYGSEAGPTNHFERPCGSEAGLSGHLEGLCGYGQHQGSLERPF